MQRLASLENGRDSAKKPIVCRSAIRRLTLSDFRSYEYLRLEVVAETIVLCGPNGAGKTNIMEALSMLIPGRGLRRAKLSDIIRERASSESKSEWSSWTVAARLSGTNGPIDVGTGYKFSVNGGAERRTVRVDGETGRSQAILADIMCMYWMTPQMDRLFQDGASNRRNFLDRLVFGWDPMHAGRISAYEDAMRQRLKLLREQNSPDPVWLSALEGTMAEQGIAVAAARADLIERLTPVALKSWGPFPGIFLGLEGTLCDWLRAAPALDVEDRFRAVLAANRDRDSRSGRTHEGPQRMDLLAYHGSKGEPANRCSTGEQKALLIALILANARMRAAEEGEAPVLLLDEVAAHLDKERREALFEGLTGIGGQIWLTGTDLDTFASLKGNAQFYSLEEGVVRNVN